MPVSLNILGGIAAYSAGHLHASCCRYEIAFQFDSDPLNELFGFNTFIIALEALVWQIANEGLLIESGRLRDFPLKVSADRGIYLSYKQRFDLNRAASLLVDHPPTTLDAVSSQDLLPMLKPVSRCLRP